MRRKIIISSDYSFLSDYIEEIPERFDSLGSLVYAGRNITREDDVKNVRLVIKSFRRIYLPNRIRYTYLYPSKAQRAFDYAKVLLEKGINTPAPIAYIEIVGTWLITKSFFISAYTDFEPLKMIVEMPFSDQQELLKEFARFTYRLHRNNVYHGDYSIGNILYRKVDSGYDFSLIDNNRMKFREISAEVGLKNLEKLGLHVEQLTFIAREYAKLRNMPEEVAVERLLNILKNRSAKGAFKKKSKEFIRKLNPIARLFAAL